MKKLINKHQAGNKISNNLTDTGTRLLHAVSSFGGSAIGDAIEGISPKAADIVEKYSLGVIPHTSQEQLEANRTGNPNRWMNRAGQTAGAVQNVALGELTGGAMKWGAGKIASGEAKQLVSKVTTPINKIVEGPLKDLVQKGPWAFKPNEGMMYRGIGEAGYKDAVNSRVFRAPTQVVSEIPTSGINLHKTFSKTYYTPNYDIAKSYADDYLGRGYIAEVPRDAANFRNRYPNKTWSQISDINIPIDKGKIYKQDWLRGYKEVKQPIKSSNFTSEINWANWNKEIPKNSNLIKEYNTIEEATKKSGNWMKNSDGSEFKGSTEQFVQQNSNNFKKAFPNPIKDLEGNVQVNYHGQRSGKPFNTFKELKNGRTGTHGKGIYTFAGSKNQAMGYVNGDEKRLYELYINSDNPQKTIKDVYSPEFDYITGRIQPGHDYLKVGKEQVIPFSNNPKSAVKNNGMFDMTNTNIYKTLLPGAILGASQIKK